MKKPTVVVDLGYGDSTFSFGRDIGKWMGFWANYMAIPYIMHLENFKTDDTIWYLKN